MSCLEGLTSQNQYVVRRFISSGGIADIYLAWDNIGMMKMAVKNFRRKFTNNRPLFITFARQAFLEN